MDGMNFTRSKENMKFLLTAFKVYHVLEEQQIGILTEKEQRKRDQEENRIREKNLNGASGSRVNYVDSEKNNIGNDKKPLFKVVCYNCCDKWHIKRYCKDPKKKNWNSNKTDESANSVEQVDTT
nr:glucose-6-phosphate isomerase 1, chloroplastic [Tanacetum cinerariifolium]